MLGLARDARDVADANLLQSIREVGRWQGAAECVETDGVLLLAGASDAPRAYRNCVARVDPRVTAQRVLQQAREFFERWKRGFTVFVRAQRDADLEALLSSEGFERRSDAPCMLIEHSLPELPAPPGIRVAPFTEERHVLDSAEVNVEAYEALGVSPEEMRLHFARPSAVLSNRVAGFVAYRDERPISTAITIMSENGGAGLYFVGSRKDSERQGLGGLCTTLATNAGFARGATMVTLQASPAGEPLYLRLGYETYDRLRWYR